MQIIAAYKQTKTINRAKLRQLELEAETALRAMQGHAMGHLYRVNIEEIAKTQRYIDSLHLGGLALDHAMGQLEQLSSELAANLMDFRHGY